MVRNRKTSHVPRYHNRNWLAAVWMPVVTGIRQEAEEATEDKLDTKDGP